MNETAIRKEAELALKDFGILVTGLRPGESIIGSKTIALGTMMNYRAPVSTKKEDLEKYIIPPRKKELDYIRNYPKLWKIYLEKLATIPFFENMNVEKREKWIEDNQSEKDIDISELGGEIEVTQTGSGDLVTKLESNQIEEISERGWMKASELRTMIPGKPGTNAERHTLFFLRWFWKISTGNAFVKNTKGLTFDLQNNAEIYPKGGKCDDGETGIVYDNFSIIINKTGIPLKTENVLEVAKDYLVECTECTDDEFDKYHVILSSGVSSFTAGGLKSLMQKIIRYRPDKVDVFGKHIPGSVAVVLTFCYLLVHPGSFVPDIQRFVSGAESAMKRLVISVYEESSFSVGESSSILQITLMAYLFQRGKSYRPTKDLLMMCFDVALDSIFESSYFRYEGDRISELFTYKNSTKLFTVDNISGTTDQSKLKYISMLCDELKSFSLDLMMMRWVGHIVVDEKGKSFVPVVGGKTKTQPSKMSILHCIDQHWTPEVVYYFYPEIVKKVMEESKGKAVPSKPFEVLLRKLFHSVTGFNPRKQTVSLGESEPDFFKEARNAQRFIYETRIEQVPLVKGEELVKGESYTFEYEIDRSWVSGALGPIEVKGRPAVMVVLHPKDIDLLVPFRKPARDVKTEEDAKLDPEREKSALTTAKGMLENGIKLKLIEPPVDMLKGATLLLTDGVYQIKLSNGKIKVWDDIRFVDVIVPTFVSITPRSICAIVMSPLSSELGISQTWREDIKKLVESVSSKVMRRVLFYLKGYGSSFEINRISKEGGGTKYSVTLDDIDALQFFLRLTDIVPAALSRKQKSSIQFVSSNPVLLWHVSDTISQLVSNDSGNVKWKLEKKKITRSLFSHQTYILDEMKSRHLSSKRNHFINATVGSGKTMIVLEYIKWLNSNDEMVEYVIYTLPGSSIDAILTECEILGFKVCIIDPRKTNPKNDAHSKYRIKLSSGGVIPKKTICLVEHDHLRKCEEELLEIIPNSIFIVDEAHKALNETKRTSVCSELSKLCVESIAMTGTPIIDTNTYKLVWWLKQISSFEVNEHNFWVAANAMITKKYRPDVEVNRIDVEVEMKKKERDLYLKLVPPSLMGKNTYATRKDISDAINLCYDVCDGEMVNEIVKRKDKGVFVVTRTASHTETIVNMLISKGVKKEDIFVMSTGKSITLSDDEVKKGNVKDYKIVITTIHKSAGYTLTRLKSMVTCVYPSNGATREQLEGRIRRIGQSAKSVDFVTFHTGILTHILNNHMLTKSMAIVVDALTEQKK